ncbi:EamA family transporter RarD [Cellulomonas aerilata]|uniref:Protein RarD n=1 Tax=Cellulomonas aerilata TaxID=515326 RepID=A0A512D8M8_9CELL|nr:EamA family transporter RarD [Cellulomonas aerilata]GEO32844.1 protein RarD [Cellulomonas aerilata]
MSSTRPTATVPTSPATAAPDRTGLALGAGAYLLWGVLPVYFPLLQPAGAVEIIGHRVVWSLGFCLLLLVVTRTWGTFVSVLRTPRTLGLLAVAAALVAVNWTTYVYGVLSDQVVDTALGYFVNPLVTVLLAVFVLGERLRRAQWVALGFGALAVVVITVGYGRLPWIALALAFSFGGYGLLKNRVGRTVPAVASLAVETLVLMPLAAGYLLVLAAQGTGGFGAHGPWHVVALVSSGVVTAVPLLLFGSAARRLPLSVVGMLQYIAPTLQFLLGVLVFGEHMPPARWFGFALVWVALVVLTTDGLRAGRAEALARRSAPATPAAA